jgi:LemA protein
MGFGVLTMVFLIVMLLGLYLIAIYNSLVRLKNDIDKAWANVDVLLKQRHDELPKLIETCKGYMQYEQKTFQLISEARSACQKASSGPERAQAEDFMTGALKSLFAVAENYPQLKADENFVHLQRRVTELEEMIADRREFLNDNVNVFNIRTQQVPDVFIARLANFQTRDFFKAADGDTKDVSVGFA